MKFYLLTIIFSLVSGMSSTHAAEAQFCDNYAATAVKQQIGNVSQSCAEKGARWSPSYTKHRAWCLGTSKAKANKELEARNNSLASCGADTYKINWNTLPDIPAVWDRLFNQRIEAVKEDDVKGVQVMHENGVNLSHVKDQNFGTILYHAVDYQAEKTAAYLLNQGGNPKITTNAGGSALVGMLQDKKINYRMLGSLLKYGFDPNYGGEGSFDEAFPLLLAAKRNDYTAVSMMLKSSGNPNLRLDATSLLYATINRNMSMIKLLIQSGANPNLSGKFSGCLPLDRALQSGSQSIIKFLKSKGAKTSKHCL